ncbi:MAG: hypothetical protein L6R43_19375 [Planctomycetes bacterium]|nr:hypothetical protein [Planctomycetota bacterium]
MRAALAAAALAALLSLPLPPAAAASGGTQVVRGRLLPTDDGSDATGKFAVAVTTRGERVKEALAVDAWGLDATKGDGGNLPSYRVFLVSADGETEADFGEAFLSARGRAKLRFSSARQDYPENADPLADFAGGRVEVRLEGDVVLEGDIPDFLGIDDENGKGSGAAARAWASTRLRHTRDAKDAKGILWCLYASKPRGEVEALDIECLAVGDPGDEVTAVAIDDEGNETELGAMTVRTRYGVAVLRLSTKRGEEIPGGGVLALAGQDVEVRAADGTVLLTGVFPSLAAE